MNKINLRSVKENNLISVAIRSEFSKEHEDVYIDEKAQEIMGKINRDFRKAKKNKKKVRDEMAKVILIDDMLSEFIKKHPNVNVVNIGCGLDTRYYRVDSEELKWYNIDFEDIINLRNEALEENKNPRIKNIALSCTDEKWAEEVDSKGSKTLFIIESLSMYLKSQEVSKVLKIISNNFKNPEVYIHVVHLSKVKNVREKRNSYDEDFYIFGVKSGKDLEKISKLKYEKEESVLSVYKKIGFSTFLKNKSKSDKVIVLKS